MGSMKMGGKIMIGIAIAGVSYGAVKYVQSRPKAVEKSQEIGSVQLPDQPEASLSGNAEKLPFPTTEAALNGGTKATILEMEWAAQTSVNYANGGAHTTKGSLFDKAGWDITLTRQDDDGKSMQQMIKWINDYKNGRTTDGLFIVDMGSQMDWYMGAIDSAVSALGSQYQAVIFDACGKSYGEDQLIARPEIFNDIKNNKQLLRGKVVRGVRLGGDLDIAIKFAGDNGVPVNERDNVYDPNALNLSYASDFLSAVQDYNSGIKEKRKLVHNGKTAGDTSVGYDMVATWFPGDYNATIGTGAAGGGTLVSTHDYAAIMPAVFITCKKYLADNADKISSLIAAHVQAGDQVRSFKDVRDFALSLDAKIWNDKDGAYWQTYYGGKQQGNAKLGGSMVYNLKDLVSEFGLQSNTDIYKEVYNTFYDVHAKLYPVDMKSAPVYIKGVDKQYMLSVVANHPELLEGKALKVDYSAPITEKVASKSVQINFATGSAVIQSSSFALLKNIARDIITSEGLKVGVYGHTDNTGDPVKNQSLSEARANSVKEYLINKCNVPVERIEAIGFGQDKPLNPESDQNSARERALNRRVEIALGN